MADQTPRRAQPPSSGATAAAPASRRRLWITALAALLVLALAFSVVHALRGNNTPASDSSAGNTGASGAASGGANGCSTPIAVDPSWMPAINAAISAYPKKGNGGCAPVQAVSTADAQVVKQGLGQAKGWIPADPSVVASNAQLAQDTPVVVGSTPVVLVAEQKVKDALGSRTLSGGTLAALASGQKTWSDFGQNWGPLRLVVPDPATSVAGAVGFQTIAATVAGGGTPTTDVTAIQSHLAQMAQVQYHVAQTVSTPDEVLKHLAAVASDDTGRGPAGPRVGVTTEYALLNSNPPAHTLSATLLAGGATGLQLSVLNPGGDQSVQDFVTWLKSSDGQKALANAGVTTSGAAPAADKLSAVGLPATMPTPVAANAAANLAQARQMYQGFSVRISTTSVLDASGSMGEPLAGSPLRKIDLVTQAATGTWQQWPNGSASALFTFNANDAGTPNIQLVVPWIVAGAPGSTQKMLAYGSHLGSIPVSGGTPLYQAIYTGYQYALQHWTPGNRNQVLVVTDGADQDAKENIDLNGLIARLKAADPKKPISLRLVAIGPDADFATLQRVAAATGGKAEWATAPSNLPAVVQDIMSS